MLGINKSLQRCWEEAAEYPGFIKCRGVLLRGRIEASRKDSLEFLHFPSTAIGVYEPKVTPNLPHVSLLRTEGVTIGEYRSVFVLAGRSVSGGTP